MSFDWKEYLEIAKYLKTIGDNLETTSLAFSKQGAHRVAISRAYYSAFCLARNHAQKFGFVKNQKGRGEHSRLRDFYKDNDHNELSSKLFELHEWRKNCDYDEDLPDGLVTENAFQTAEEIITSLPSISISSNSPTKSKLLRV